MANGKKIILREMSVDEFLEEKHFFDRICTYDEEGKVIKEEYVFVKEEVFHINTSQIASNVDDPTTDWTDENGFSIRVEMPDIPPYHETPGIGAQNIYILTDEKEITFYTWAEYLEYKHVQEENKK